MIDYRADPRIDEPHEIAALWCIRLSDGDMTDDEWRDFEAWLAAEPGNGELLRDASTVWQVSELLGDQPEVVALRSEALAMYQRESARRWFTVRPRRFARFASIAATVLFVCAATMVWVGQRPDEYATGIGGRQAAVLADGSRVTLDAATSVDVRMKQSERQVELVAGRAKFDVEKDPLRPFTVAVGDKMVVALGTSFSVELINGEVRVILYEGQVEVRDRADIPGSAVSGGRRQVMMAGSEYVAAVGDGEGHITRPELSQSLNWEQGVVMFEDELLASAVARMNRYSSKPIRLSSPALGGIRISGIFKAGDTAAFLEGVSEVHGVRPRVGDGEIILEPQ